MNNQRAGLYFGLSKHLIDEVPVTLLYQCVSITLLCICLHLLTCVYVCFNKCLVIELIIFHILNWVSHIRQARDSMLPFLSKGDTPHQTTSISQGLTILQEIAHAFNNRTFDWFHVSFSKYHEHRCYQNSQLFTQFYNMFITFAYVSLM